MPSKRSPIAIPFCKICGKNIEQNAITSWLFAAKTVCLRCFHSLKPTYYRWRVSGVRAMAIYPYSQEFKSLLYRYKGCGDIELDSVFLERVLPLLRCVFKSYWLVPVPSHPRRIAERGFDHVPRIFNGMGKGIIHALTKVDDVKQSDRSKTDRRLIGKSLSLMPKTNLRGKRILLVDDVFTTGSSVRACLALLRKAGARTIRVLVLSKVILDP